MNDPETNENHDLTSSKVPKKSRGRKKKIIQEESSNSIAEDIVANENNSVKKSSLKIKNQTQELKKQNESEEIFECSHCNFKSNKRLLLKKHTASDHTDKGLLLHKCDYCDKEFKELIQLSNHLNAHLGLKPYECEQCKQAFTTRGELTRHIRYKHTMEKPHKCTFCDYSSVELSKLKRHMRIHTDERPYLCPYCEYASRDTFKLKRHMRIHTGEKPYECPLCESKFSQSNSLKVHLNSHHKNENVSKKKNSTSNILTGQSENNDTLESNNQTEFESKQIITENSNPETSLLNGNFAYEMKFSSELNLLNQEQHECKECSMKFSTEQLLNEHVQIHKSDRPFVCQLCGMRFAQRFALNAHVLSHDSKYAENLKLKLKTINESTAMATNLNKKDQNSSETNENNKDADISISSETSALEEQTENKKRRKRKFKELDKSNELNDEPIENKDKEIKHFCILCSKKFVSEPNLNRHKRNFHLESDFDAK